MAVISVALILRFEFGLDPLVAALVSALLMVALAVLIVRYRRSDKAWRRNAMLATLREPIWATVLSQMLALCVLGVGNVFLTREDHPVNLWTLARVMAEVFFFAGPVLVAMFAALAYSQRRSIAAALARGDA
jgi:amino acid transporter